SDASTIQAMLVKTLSGYLIAFIASIIIWILLSRVIKKLVTGQPHPMWRVFQWIISGSLWAAWLMQDAANVAVSLPRSLAFWQFAIFTLSIFFGLGVLFYNRGDRIQEVVNEKSDVRDTRSATIIDFVYAGVLYYFTI